MSIKQKNLTKPKLKNVLFPFRKKTYEYLFPEKDGTDHGVI